MFITEQQINEVYVFVKSVDFRKGLFGLASLITREFGSSSGGRNLFVFTNSSHNRVRIVYWDDTGFAMWVKILESAKFKWPQNDESEFLIDPSELKLLLSGIDIQKQKPHKKSSAKAIY